jgi:hypothetical protein
MQRLAGRHMQEQPRFCRQQKVQDAAGVQCTAAAPPAVNKVLSAAVAECCRWGTVAKQRASAVACQASISCADDVGVDMC